MVKHELEKPEAYPLNYQTGWQDLLGNPEGSVLTTLNTLTDLTQCSLLASPSETPEWAHERHEVFYRWQQMVEWGVKVHARSIDGRERKQYFAETPETEILNAGLKLITTAVENNAWQEKGTVLLLPMDNLNPHQLEEIDIRQMGPPQPMVTMDFETFKQFSDEEVKDLVTRFNEYASKYGVGFMSVFQYPIHGQIFDDNRRLKEYIEHRKYGVPDRELTEQEIRENLRQYVDYRVEAEPGWGDLPEDFEELDERERQAVGAVFQYFDGSVRSLAEHPTVDSYSLYRTLGLEEEDTVALVGNKVLKFVDTNESPVGTLGCTN